MAYDFENAQKDALTLPRNKAWSNWAKFEAVGDKVSGYIRDVFYRKAEGVFKESRGITLETPEGEFVNVAIKRVQFIMEQTDTLKLGDPLTVKFEKQLAPKQPGFKGAKQFGFYGKNLDENAANKTVKELDAEDMAKQGIAEKAADAELDKLAEVAG